MKRVNQIPRKRGKNRIKTKESRRKSEKKEGKDLSEIGIIDHFVFVVFVSAEEMGSK
jgi:hypothetical protein